MDTHASTAQADRAGRRLELPRCAAHPGSSIHRVRTNGPRGPGSYVECRPADGSAAHLLEWPPVPGRVRA